jgi:hypothetical protein
MNPIFSLLMLPPGDRRACVVAFTRFRCLPRGQARSKRQPRERLDDSVKPVILPPESRANLSAGRWRQGPKLGVLVA